MTISVKNSNYASQPHILVVDDDDRIRDLVARYLREQDFFVNTASDAQHAKEILKIATYDAVVLDVMMPGQDGMELTEEIRMNGNDIPILLLTAMGETDDKIKGLSHGADDYLTKPFDPRELVLRLKAILRRKPQLQTLEKETVIGHWLYYPDQKELTKGDKAIRLTDGEATMLNALLQQKGQVMSRENLAKACDMDPDKRTVDVQVTRLRRKIEEDSNTPRYLQTIRGKGYVLRTEE